MNSFSNLLFCRATRLSRRTLTNAHRNILDGKLIAKYLGLNFTERLELARKIGTTSSQVWTLLYSPSLKFFKFVL